MQSVVVPIKQQRSILIINAQDRTPNRKPVQKHASVSVKLLSSNSILNITYKSPFKHIFQIHFHKC